MNDSKFQFQNITPNHQLPFRLLIHSTGAEHTVQRHWHTSFEISYVISGRNENFYIDGKTFNQSINEIVVVNPYQVHGLDLPKSNDRIAMTLMLPKEFLEFTGLNYRNIRLKNQIPTSDRTEQLFDELYRISLKPDSNKAIHQIGLVCLIFSDLIDSWSEEVDWDATLEISKGLSYLDPVLIWLENNYVEQITIADMARVAKISSSYFAHLFKKYIQQSPMEYLILIRLRHAQQLLKNTDDSISQIAEKTGFINYISFVNAFKKNYKITPKKYQKIYKNSI